MQERNWQVLSGFVLKVIALLTMTFDHIGFFLMLGNNSGTSLYQVGFVFRCIGRIAFPLLIMLCAEGVRYSRHPWKYFLRLLIMDVAIKLVMVVYLYGINPNSYPGANDGVIQGNAFADLALVALTLILLKLPGWKKSLAALPIAFTCLVFAIQIYETSKGMVVVWLPSFLRPGYSLFGLLIALGFYFAYPIADRLCKPLREAISMTEEAYRDTNAYRRLVNGIGSFALFAVTLIFWGLSYVYFDGAASLKPLDPYWMGLQSYCLLALPLLFLYSGKRGYDSKPMRWITYLYYPVHMAVLLAIFWL
ncbi:MAG: hypothetical protein IJS37_02020 [Bacilli bacterium]|nr:hypothetical protein [Bacilli bacterium]